MSLHALVQGQKVGSIPWLNSVGGGSHKTSLTDMKKRVELYLEFLYFAFDSILIPLLRSTFHITESSQHGNRLFFFRHDVWRALAEPAIKEIKQSTFVELPKNQVAQLLKDRKLGVGHVRLMPKGAGVRMITNLRRKPVIQRGGKVVLGQSVNAQLEAVHCMLKCERANHRGSLGGSLFSADEMHPRIKAFQERVLHGKTERPELYFAKVDVKSCFDTIPQQQLIRVVSKLCSEDAYSKHRHVELRDSTNRARKFVSSAQTLFGHMSFDERLEAGSAAERHGTVFSEIIMDQVLDKDWLVGMLEEHVRENVVRIGKKYFRQRNGIPQGSVLSTMLCSFFYADFEKRHLAYLDPGESLLLRLIDDFLLITTNGEHAVRFVEQMHAGCEEYGIQVQPEKTMTSFPRSATAASSGEQRGRWFPWCGVVVHTHTLELSRDRGRRLAGALKDSLTVERGVRPGAAFVRKTLHAFRVQTTAMLTDTAVNAPRTVLTTLYLNFVETAMKMHRYLKTCEVQRPVADGLIISESGRCHPGARTARFKADGG